jgi:hypothetical protein
LALAFFLAAGMNRLRRHRAGGSSESSKSESQPRVNRTEGE